MKLIKWIEDNVLFVCTLFLLLFIPLYPKLPILDIKNTWVYIRAEDFAVVIVLCIWALLLFRRKISLKTPLTLPIMAFWIIGAIATIHAVLLIFPNIANVFPNVALLSFLRRIEYLSLFFVAFSSINNKRSIYYTLAVLTLSLFLVVAYGMGQKYLGFPAYLTMNEEFAKGLPIQLSALSRVPSTFGGHYDLAAYLVLVIPIIVAMIFAFRSILIRLIFVFAAILGFTLLFMTVSRVSFFVLLISLIILLFLHKKRFVIYLLPPLILFGFVFLSFSSTLLERFGNTLKEVDVLVDASSGGVVGHTQKVPSNRFENIIIKRKIFKSPDQLSVKSLQEDDSNVSTISAVVPFASLAQELILVEPPNTPTGENLPQGTGYINLSLSPVTKRTGEFFYVIRTDQEDPESTKAFMFQGDFLIKRASAYDLSFTTRFQGEWPRAIEAFKRNILFGSGYSSISLAVDNNYLRILGEVGILGFAAFITIFLVIGIYIKKVYRDVESPIVRSFVLGFVAGVIGLALNALLIDVFEASKVAFLLWILTGVTLGMMHLYQKESINLYFELKKMAVSSYAVIVYLSIISIIIFSPLISYYFVGDDYTWLRWIADCTSTGSQKCLSPESIFGFFSQADGFFYRPGTKTYFLIMYSFFWLNQIAYHFVSILLHFVVAVLLYLLSYKLLKDNLTASLVSLLFLISSGYSEAVFWISSTGFLVMSVFALSSLLLFMVWEEKKKDIYFVGCLISVVLGMLFHEQGIVIPLLIAVYKLTMDEKFSLSVLFKNPRYSLLLFPILPYLLIRYYANSHWFGGDYSYSILKLPFNTIGNTIGYTLLTFMGPISLPFYQIMRDFMKQNLAIALVISIFTFAIIVIGYKYIFNKLERQDRKIVIFSLLFFLIGLLPFLGLGNITSRYNYLASIGLIILFAYFVKKMYLYLISYGKDIALATSGVVISVFCLLHIIQIQQIHIDWYHAGEKAKRFIVTMDGLYSDEWASLPMKFHFVNVPIRHGEAWVFPVGLSDALWFAFRNPNIQIYQHATLDEAYNAVTDPPNEKIFVFEENGKVVEKKKVLYMDINSTNTYQLPIN